MIDAQAGDLAAANQLERLAAAVFEHFGQLDAQAHQFVDIEEAAVIDLLVTDFPVGQAVSLLREQTIQIVERIGEMHQRLVESSA